MRELQELEKEHPEYQDENSPTMRVGSDLNKNFTQIAHKYPMLSLGNTYSENEVTDFYDRVKKALNEDFEICCELKYDGTSISLTYENGKLVRAVTRGDGEKGESRFDGRCRFDAVLYYCREFYLPAECDQLAVGPDAPRIFGLFDYAE